MRHLIDITDFSRAELDELLALGAEIAKNPRGFGTQCAGKILATLFFEPSTRTRLSFESAMLSLGGQVLGFSEASSSSASKGESVSDTARMASCYADIIAMRHPKEGAPMMAAQYASVPVINAGDGGHCHPTQTLTDLLTLLLEKGRIDGLTVGMCGDLKYGRTVHSLINALALYKNVRVVLISPAELAIPQYMKSGALANMDYSEAGDLSGALPALDVLYMTRIQRERFDDAGQYDRLKDSYILNAEKMALAAHGTVVLHPLPRVSEISTDVDDDPRAAYFRQAQNGKYIRMALLMSLLGGKLAPRGLFDKAGAEPCLPCENPKCITQTAPEHKHFSVPDGTGGRKCPYCEQKI